MLSEKEYNDIIHKLNQPSSTISTNTKKNLQKKLKEHEYSIKLAPFDPLPHMSYFINRTTSANILHRLIQAATASTEVIIDTESWNVFRQTNKPALIQLQILLPRDSSFILLVETCHLSQEDNIVFTLTQQLFQKIFTPEKMIFIFGPKDELYPFTQFKLFSYDQIYNSKMINLQAAFKIFWNKHHPHESTSSTALTTLTNCMCEKCIGKNSADLWSLQDCVAYLLNEYLPKTLSNENFQIGLDPELFELNRNEEQYRNRLSTYAKNDCLSMQRLIIQMKNQQFNFNSSLNKPICIQKNKSKFKLPNFYNALEPISSDDDYPSEEQITNQILFPENPPAPSIDNLERKNEATTTQDSMMTHTQEQISAEDTYEDKCSTDWKSNTTNENLASVNHEQAQSPDHAQPRLSAEERKRIHNRSCTIRQRNRYYQVEIIRRNIDRRFSIKQIKRILRQHDISFSAVNTSKSRSNKISLYIGIKHKDKLNEYDKIARHLFTTDHYRSLRRYDRPISSSNRSLTSAYHQHSHYRTTSSDRILNNQTTSDHRRRD